jgi:ribosomal-protein-alanine N-acetyltransferase
MQSDHIAAVIALEEAAYHPHRPYKNYEYELQKNPLSYYFILENQSSPQVDLIGPAGIWLIAAELHLTTLAVHPDWQGLGLGEYLLLTLLERGQVLEATVATLEVRPSNQAALAIYHKYAFERVGCRRRYYADGEDALILTTPPLASPNYQAMLQQRETVLRQRLDKVVRIHYNAPKSLPRK